MGRNSKKGTVIHMCFPKKMAKNLISQYATRDPLELCEIMGINIVFCDLPKTVNGFFTTIRKHNIIYINQELYEDEQKEVCAHELGHIMLHPQCNLLFMMDNTLFVTQKFEIEADLFASYLLIDEQDFAQALEYGQTEENISRILGVSKRFVALYAKNNHEGGRAFE